MVLALQVSPESESTSRRTITSDKIAPCLWFDLAIKGTNPPYTLLLTASFGLHRFPVLGGTVDFGLKQAELHLGVTGGSIPLASRWPKSPLQQETVVKRTLGQEEATTRKDSAQIKAVASQKGAAGEVGMNQEDGQEQRQSTKDEFDLSIHSVASGGSPNQPIWRFRALPGQTYLQGQLVEQVIGQLDIDKSNDSAKIDARCEIMKRFVHIIDSDGFLAGLAVNSKLAVLRALVRKAIFTQLKDCLRSIQLEAGSDG